MPEHKEQYNFEEILKSLRSYCAYQERSIYDAEKKLSDLAIKEQDVQMLIDTLKEEGYLDQDRFVRSFVRGKIKIKKWGRNKIFASLKAKRVEPDLISEALWEIDEEEYMENLHSLLNKKRREMSSNNKSEKLKLYRYLMSKGYEGDLVYQEINRNQ